MNMLATVIICIVLAAVVILGMRTYRKKLSSGCCGSESDGAPKKIKVQDKNLSHYPYEKDLHIDGMTCQNCVAHVENALNSLDGVFSRVDLGKKRAVVHMKEELPDEILRKTVAGAGYIVMSVDAAAQ